MLTLDAQAFAGVINAIRGAEIIADRNEGHLPQTTRNIIPTIFQQIEDGCVALNLPMTRRAAAYLHVTDTSEQLKFASKHINLTILSELEGRNFYGPTAGYEKYFQNKEFFGDNVLKAFPSAIDELEEAGTCLALERSTACVMHLMRALEVGLKVLASTVGIIVQSDWGAYIREIEKTLTSRMKTSGVRSSDEQFYAESSASFDSVKRAWRNPTMHVERTYTQERAEEILLSVKSFMTLLASRLKE